jgi:PST family polysaccharide transporter
VFLAAPLFGSLSVVAPETVEVLVGERWTPAVLPIQILAVAALLNATLVHSGIALSASGRPILALANQATSFIVSNLAILVLGPFGLVGASAALTLRWLAPIPYSSYLLKRNFAYYFKNQLVDFLPPLVSSLCVIFSVIVFRNIFCNGLSPAITLAVDFVIGFLSYTFFSMIFCRKLVIGLFHLALGSNRLQL